MTRMRPLRVLVAVTSLAASLLASGPGVALPPPTCGPGTPDQVSTGSFGAAERGAYVLVPFDVPAGTTSVRVRLCHDQIDLPSQITATGIKHTLDLGVFDAVHDGNTIWGADEFRGWGGSSRLNVLISPEDTTTVGFEPGPITPGRWAAEIGVAAIAETGDADGLVSWRLEVLLDDDPADADEPWQPTPYDETPASPEAGWYKGDFHVHARHSNPSDATMREVFDFAFGQAGLDFITLSDYVTGRQWDEIGAYQADYPGSLIVRSAEVITYRGHLNNHASATWVDYRTGPVYELLDDALVLRRPATPPSAIFETIHAAGGWTQVNHPTIFPSKVPPFALQCRGCSWEYADEETDWNAVDAFEVQTGPAGYTDPQGSEPGPNPFTPPAIEWWDRLHRSGFDITAVGSSDSHKAAQESLTTSPIGEATTVVYAPELSEAGIRTGILAGHAYVKFFGAAGPDLRFDAVGGGSTAMMGDELLADEATFTARVIGGAPTAASPLPRTLIVVFDGVPILALPVPEADFSFSFPASVPGDYRLQLMRGSAIEALTNPITLRAPS